MTTKHELQKVMITGRIGETLGLLIPLLASRGRRSLLAADRLHS
jgi:hypothetical protein